MGEMYKDKTQDRNKRRDSHQRQFIQLISQISLELIADNLPQQLSLIRKNILDWAYHKSGISIPSSAYEGKSCFIENVGETIFLDSQEYWAARFEDQDKEIAGRKWVVEVGMAPIPNSSKAAMFAARVYCSSKTYAPIQRSTPKFIRELGKITQFYLDGQLIKDYPIHIDSEDGVEQLIDLIESPQRTRDIIAISLPPGEDDARNCVISPLKLSIDLYGGAHIFSLSNSACHNLTNKVGRQLAVFGGSVRTYKPHTPFTNEHASAHPVATYASIENWAENNSTTFEFFLKQQALRSSISHHRVENELPKFSDIKAAEEKIRHEQLRKEGASDADFIQMLQDEVSTLNYKILDEKNYYETLIEEYANETRQALAERDGFASQFYHMQAKLLEFEKQAKNKDEEIEIPSSFEALEDWCNKHLAGSVYVHSKAIKAAKKSVFENVPLAYKSLLLLKNFYQPMRLTGEGKERYEEELKNLLLDDSFTGESTNRDEYYVIYNGQRRYLTRHLKGSNDKDPRKGFRLYYFWDDIHNLVVVGAFPEHLTNRAT